MREALTLIALLAVSTLVWWEIHRHRREIAEALFPNAPARAERGIEWMELATACPMIVYLIVFALSRP